MRRGKIRPGIKGTLLHFLKLLFLFPALLPLLAGCQPNYFLIHPLEPVAGIFRECGFFDRDQLRLHWLARFPEGRGKLPAVLVHPDRGSLAKDMEGICLALAREDTSPPPWITSGWKILAKEILSCPGSPVRTHWLPWNT